jgi:hypothetical protein
LPCHRLQGKGGDSTHKRLGLGDNVGDIHVVGGGAKLFVLLGSEDVNTNEMDLGVTVLAGLGGGHVYDLAGAVLDADETVLPESGTLHGESGRSAGAGLAEVMVVLL